MNKISQVLDFGEPKKHSVRFNAAPTENNPPLASIYVMRTALGAGPLPKKILVTIEEVTE